ncbi:MAG: SCP2 sterol-binding domain-containing protein [Nitrososphaerota archaeon]|jgi:putative sterol carrier protein|nr:SCP2 sterol-binding domain-containing protein [Nitrososphaerota archaeon]
MEGQTPREFFEKILPTKFKPEKAKGITTIAQFNVSGSDGGNWFIIIKNQELQITEGMATSPDLTFKLSDTDFLDLVTGKISAEKAVFTGKIQFEGNIVTALRLRDAGFL